MKRLDLLWWLPVAILVGMRLHNAWVTPSSYGMDNYGNTWQLLQVYHERRVPLANEGWCDYYPPLFDLVSASLAWLLGSDPLRTAQCVSTVASLGVLPLVFGLARRLVGAQNAWYAVITLAALPADVFTAATVFNLSTAYFLATLFLWLLVTAWQDRKLHLGREIALGLVAGAAWMTRTDAAITLLMLGVLWLARLFRDRAGWLHASWAAGVSILIAVACNAWYFLRNLADFGRLFVHAADPDVLPLDVAVGKDFYFLPGTNPWVFYLNPGLQIFSTPQYPAATESFWGVIYASLWWCYYDRYQGPLGVPCLVASLLPTGLAWFGLVFTVRHRWSQWWPLPVNIAVTLAFYLTAIHVLPIAGFIKGLYLYTSFAAWALCMAAGAIAVTSRWPRLTVPLRLCLCLQALLVAYAGWCPA